MPPCFAVTTHSRRNTSIFPATNVCLHVMKYFAWRRFLMPSVVHLRISVLPGSHLPGLSGSAPSALSPPQRFASYEVANSIRANIENCQEFFYFHRRYPHSAHSFCVLTRLIIQLYNKIGDKKACIAEGPDFEVKHVDDYQPAQRF